MLTVSVYGFGSYFSAPTTANDIDILIVHESLDRTSCEFAIFCKSRLHKLLAHLHVTMLSAKEEQDAYFIATAQAYLLGAVSKNDAENNLLRIANIIKNFDKKPALQGVSNRTRHAPFG